MSYFLISLLVSLGTIFLSSLIFSLVNRDEAGPVLTNGIVFTIIYTFILWCIYWLSSPGIYGPTPLFWPIIFGFIIGFIITGIPDEFDAFGDYAFPFFGIIVYCLYAIIIAHMFNSSDMSTSQKKASLIGEVEVVTNLNEILSPADPAHICLVSEDMAKLKANDALSKFVVEDGVVPGSRYKIGEGTKQFVDGQLWYIFPLEFQSYFKWKKKRTVPGYLRVSAENPFEDAQPVQFTKAGDPIKVKYLNSACFDNLAERYLRNNGFKFEILRDWTFEPNDNWEPFYTVSLIKRNAGFVGATVEGVLVLNLQTGEFKLEEIEKLPTWIDRGIPLNVLDEQLDDWAEYYQESWSYVIWHDDKSMMQTPGWYMTYGSDGKCKWFTGLTSKSSEDKGLLGFTLSDARTGKTVMFKTGGVTEDVAYDAARSLWSEYEGYNPTELVVYNVYGVLTYVIPMSYRGQFVGVSLVSLNNKDVKARGANIDEAWSSYRSVLSKSKSSSLRPNGGKLEKMAISGEIDRVGIPIIQGKQQIFTFTVKGEEKVFQAIYSFGSPKVPLMKKGDLVNITFTETMEKVVTCEKFDIPAIKLSEKSPVQTRYENNQKEVKKEVNRVKKIEKRNKLQKSKSLKDVDPEALEKFLEEQSKK